MDASLFDSNRSIDHHNNRMRGLGIGGGGTTRHAKTAAELLAPWRAQEEEEERRRRRRRQQLLVQGQERGEEVCMYTWVGGWMWDRSNQTHTCICIHTHVGRRLGLRRRRGGGPRGVCGPDLPAHPPHGAVVAGRALAGLGAGGQVCGVGRYGGCLD